MINDFHFLHSSFDGKSEQSYGSSVVPEIYLVEDDIVFGKTLKLFLEKRSNLTVHFYESPGECVMALEDRKNAGLKINPFCLITDISFNDGGADGLLLIDLLNEKGFNFVSIAMTGFASIETAINATKKGVFHYLTKPFELEDLYDLTVKALVKLGYSEDVFSKSFESKKSQESKSSIITKKFKLEAPSDEDMFCGMIGRSKQMKQVFERIKKVAASNSTVLVNGPSGTGKELIANALHKLSKRNTNPLISVNCGAIPSELLESELFGHEKGAFTGAISSRKGRFEMANTGSIFLDEIGDMPLLLQVKLLRVLQSRVIERVGSTTSTPIDVRIITATHRDLEKAVEEGDFREDLFYRLNVIPIKVPALSKRREDIPLLISYFLQRYVSADGRNKIQLEDDALECLMTYDWPGNVRELENLIERLVILKGGSSVGAKDLPAKFYHNRSEMDVYNDLIDLPDDGIDLKKILSDIEESLIVQALNRTEGNKNQASKLLSINRTTLIEKLKKKGLMDLNS